MRSIGIIKGVSRLQVGAYALAAFGIGLITQPMTLYLPQIYAKELGINLGALGAALVLTQVLDAVSQQVCGALSDQTRTRWGARKPWIACGATIAVFAAFFLMKPPPGVGLVWFFCWKIVFDFGLTARNIGYYAWGAELSGDYRTRSNIMGASSLTMQMGNVANDVLPIIVFYLGLTASSAYSMKVMGYYFVAAAVAIPVLHAVALIGAPTGVAQPPQRPNLLGMFDSVRQNKPFWLYLTSFTLSGLGIGALSLNFTFYDGYLRVGKWFPYLMTIFSVTTVVTIPMWVWVANRIGKHRAYAISMVIGGAAPLGWFLFDPNKTSQSTIIAFGAVVVFLIGVGVGCNFVTTTAILADIVDYGTLKTGVRRTASYFAFYLLTNKVAIAIGSGLAFMGISAFGYNAKMGATNTHVAKLALLAAVSLVPAMLKIPAGVIMWWYPLTARRHSLIQRRLTSRTERLAQALAADGSLGLAIEPLLAADAKGAARALKAHPARSPAL